MNECVCGYIGRTDNLNRHKKRCKAFVAVSDIQFKLKEKMYENKILKKSMQDFIGENSDVLINKQKECEKVNLLLLEKDHEIQRLRNKIETKDEEIQKLLRIPKTQQVIQENIMPYNEMNTLDKCKVLKLLRQWIPNQSVINYLRMKHFSKETTKNIRMTNVRSNTIQVYKREFGLLQWYHVDKKEALMTIIIDALDELIDTGANTIANWNIWYTNSGLHTSGFEKTSSMKILMNKTEKLLMNSRQICHSQNIFSFGR